MGSLAFAQSLERRFLGDLEVSREITVEDMAARSIPRRLQQAVARLLSPIL